MLQMSCMFVTLPAVLVSFLFCSLLQLPVIQWNPVVSGLQPSWRPNCGSAPHPPLLLEPQCQYFKNVHSFSGSGYQYRLHDIEDLKGFGRSHKACPYFTARKWAEVRWRRVYV